MQRLTIYSTILLLISFPALSQDLYETGELLIDANFDDFDPAQITTNNVSVVGVFDDVPGNDTGALEMEVPGNTTNSWDEQLQANIPRPENSEEVSWRLQYRVRVEETPYDIELRMQITEDPWTGFSITQTIPEGSEGQWLFYDYVTPPFAQFSTDEINFSLRIGAQPPQYMQWDDIKLYNSNALGDVSFESRADERLVRNSGVTWERMLEANAPEGAYIYRTKVDENTSMMEDAWVALSRFVPGEYDGALRLTMTVRTDTAPLEIRAGMADSSTLDGQVVYAQETQTVTEENTWSVISFLVQPVPFDVTRVIPFIQFGGQGAAQLDIDRVFTLKTDETIDNPVRINDWALF